MEDSKYISAEFDEAEAGPDLKRFVKAILSRKWMILALALASGVLAAMVSMQVKPVYEATATLMFRLDQTNLLAVEDLYEAGTQRREYLSTETQMLQSRHLAERVISKMGLLDSPEFRPIVVEKSWSNLFGLLGSGNEGSTASVSRTKLEQVTSAFLARVTVEPVRNTHLVKVTFRAGSPQLAADVANTLVEEYISSQSDNNAQLTSRATSWLDERLQILQGKLEESEGRLREFTEQENLVDTSGVSALASQELNNMTAQLQDMRVRLNQASTLYDQVADFDGEDISTINIPEILNDPMIQDIKRSEAVTLRNIAELSRLYLEKHPKLIAANRELSLIREQLATEVNNKVDSIRNDYITAESRVRAQEQALALAKQDFQALARKDVRYQELKHEVDMNRELYNALLVRSNEAREATGFDTTTATLSDPAVAPDSPESPNTKLIAAAAFAAGAALGVAIAIVMELLKFGVRGPDDVERVLKQRVIGLLPLVKDAPGQRLPLNTFFEEKGYIFAESIRTLRTGVVLSHLESPAKLMAVTSSVAGEGKTTVAENLAIALAQMEKVLLIDGDLRSPSVGPDFNLDESHPGLVDALQGECEIEQCIHFHPESGLYVMPAGTFHSDPQKLLISGQFPALLGKLAEQFDRIVVDTPPLQAVSDALIISHACQSTLYVVKCGATHQQIINRGIARFQQSGEVLDGVVLNQVNVASRSGYGEEFYGYDYMKMRGRKTQGPQASRVVEPQIFEGEAVEGIPQETAELMPEETEAVADATEETAEESKEKEEVV